MPTPIYHITHIDNLESILKSDGLIANSRLRRQQIPYRDLAYENIQDRRARIRVPCGAGGVLPDYVPFYFAPRSPMLYTIHKGNIPGYSQGQNLVIHLVSLVKAIDDLNLGFVFTDGHALMEYSDFYDDIWYLDEAIDWEVMGSKYWFDTEEDPNRKCKRQAEFLVHQFCPWTLITEIGVINSTIQGQVQQILQKINHKPLVKIHSDWYY
ncbi:MAG TPA: DUF4433 domain-containing protein [Cyanobacteria bacterium UBA11149]|nr:DUF4433 domain-containing protein [Cyanobacteria bacterium UBA11367]HBE58762.1 DUF4433 domain-containing protein [Cyanobacteria bacterium UBA11366]HBK63729.1 DUF4433 domain-containing protein [Cyanobacteria bacterium UBA11166]HBR73256.1 DUF4433 domain-containing protein [Cyanobacteria bacterium UBA11159]HBS68811.1 DUF4433 domain-containing protein [Cyanobacteria bacterium UBA11153]HBW92439.1 DUF4433 domain-containing protein [Cyanobacteria bacterium UBA11149]HCA97486.1 DUF4433 domain-conta